MIWGFSQHSCSHFWWSDSGITLSKWRSEARDCSMSTENHWCWSWKPLIFWVEASCARHCILPIQEWYMETISDAVEIKSHGTAGKLSQISSLQTFVNELFSFCLRWACCFSLQKRTLQAMPVEQTAHVLILLQPGSQCSTRKASK